LGAPGAGKVVLGRGGKLIVNTYRLVGAQSWTWSRAPPNVEGESNRGTQSKDFAMTSADNTEHFAGALVRAILEGESDAIIGSDRDGMIAFWNQGAQRVFGYSAAEAVGQSLDIIIPERLRDAHWKGYSEVMGTGRSRYGSGDLLTVPGIRKDGQRISLEFTIVPLSDAEGHMAGMAAILRDVTARFEELKTLRRRLAEVNRLAPAIPSA
jgi:PAS domain S-box-containing protein